MEMIKYVFFAATVIGGLTVLAVAGPVVNGVAKSHTSSSCLNKAPVESEACFKEVEAHFTAPAPAGTKDVAGS